MDYRNQIEQKTVESVEKGEGGIVAVIVGIDGYNDKKAKPLQCAVNDAVSLMETLQKVWQNKKVKIKTLIWPSLKEEKKNTPRKTWGIELPPDAGGVTPERILAEVREYADRAEELDTFLFYFSGHGVLIGEEPALVAVADGKAARGIEYLKIEDIQQVTAGCKSHKKVMILDCCQSAAGKNQTNAGYKNLENLTRDWSILISSSPGEVSLEDHYSGKTTDDYLQQGIFTASLVEGLHGGASGGSSSVSLADLAYFVGKRVPIEYEVRWKLYQDRFMASLKGEEDQNPTDTRGEGLNSQNPVLLSHAVAMDGPYQVLIAPETISNAQDLRRKIPSRQFLKYWFKFLMKPWPIVFPFRWAFYLAGLFYAGAVMFTVLWNSQDAIQTTPVQVFSWIVGIGSVFLWWLTIPFAVASNEDYWHIGGYFTVLFYFIWHGIVVIGFFWIYRSSPLAIQDSMLLGSLIFEMFFLFVGVLVFGCNASQTIVALAEPLRSDYRREIRQAIRVFQQFKYTLIGVDLFNYVALISLRPDAYFYGWIVSIVFVGGSLMQRLALGVEKYQQIIIVREILIMALVTVLVFWYYSAYKHFQHEVYKK